MQPCHVFEHLHRCTLHIALLTVANRMYDDEAVQCHCGAVNDGGRGALFDEVAAEPGGERTSSRKWRLLTSNLPPPEPTLLSSTASTALTHPQTRSRRSSHCHQLPECTRPRDRRSPKWGGRRHSDMLTVVALPVTGPEHAESAWRIPSLTESVFYSGQPASTSADHTVLSSAFTSLSQQSTT